MKKLLLLVILFACLFVLMPGPASATAPEVVEITYEMTSIVNGTPWLEGGNMFYTFTREDVVSDLEGRIALTGTLEGIVRIHPNGKITWHGNATWVGTIDGFSGTFDTVAVGLNLMGPPPESVHGQTTIISGTGDFENLQGAMAFSGGLAGGAGTLRYHFDP